MPIWNFLQGKFDSMPAWVRVSTYLVLLLLSVYLYLAPRFVSGQIVARTQSGGFVPYRGVAIQTQVAGHTLKFNTNEDGYWTIPIVDRKPNGIKLQVFHEDDRSWFPVTIDAADIWTEEFRIVISTDEPFVALEYAAFETGAPRLQTQMAAFFGLLASPARAGTLEYQPRAIMPPPAAAASDGETELSAAAPEDPPRQALLEEVRRVVSDVTGKPLTVVGPEFRLTAANGVGYVQRIQIVEDLERAHDIKIPDEHWRNLGRVQELADYIADLRDLETRFRLPKDLSKSGDWAKIQQYFPVEARPKFSY